MSKELVHAKSAEIVNEVAKATGVKAPDVEKLLTHLGLQTALANRLSFSAKDIRIAAGQLMQ